MASVTFQLIEEVTARAQSDSLEGAREICTDGTYFLNNLRICLESDFEITIAASMLAVHYKTATFVLKL